MGLISKQRTKARTAPAVHVTSLSGRWMTEGMPHMAAIVRAAASSLAGGKELKSSGFRGHDTLGISSAMRSGGSTIWVEQKTFVSWAIGLGLNTIQGPAYDWHLELRASTADDGTVSVAATTPHVLTKDGAQVHKNEYLEVRELVIAGLAAPAMPRPNPETAVNARGLSFLPAPFAEQPLAPYDGTFALATKSSPTEVRECLETLHFSRLQVSAGGARWAIGLRDTPALSWAELTIEPHADDASTLRFTVHLAEDDNTAISILSTRHARRFVVCVLAALRLRDENATISAGGELTDGIS